MDRFFIIVLSIAVVLLILILTFIGLMMKSTSTNNAVFPPVVNTCPDYWSVGMDTSSCAIPTDSTQKNVGIQHASIVAMKRSECKISKAINAFDTLTPRRLHGNLVNIVRGAFG